MKYTDLNCIRCGKDFSDVPKHWGDDGPPNDGLIFTSHGNYGSTVYDPIGSQEYLVINLCDACAVAQAAEGNVMHICMPQKPPPPRYRGPWQPQEPEDAT